MPHTCLMTEKPRETQAESHVVELKEKVNNSSLMKHPIILISAVTAFFSDKDVEDEHQSPAPVHPIRTLLQGREEGSIVIVLGHHPPDWFTQETGLHLNSLLLEHNALYLHGHEHRIKARYGPRGLTCLGFGAAYVAPNDSAPTPYYRNSYAFCELTDSLHVSFLSWDAEHGQWRSDQRLPGEFDERSNRFRDGFCVPLPTTRIAGTHRFSSIAAAVKPEVRIEQCLWLVEDHTKRWLELLLTLRLLRGVTERYAVAPQTLPAGHTRFRTKDQRGRQHLVYAVSGHGDIFHYDQLQSINTELDRQDYDGCIIATLGEYSGEARSLATQLSFRKEIIVLERDDVVRGSVDNLPVELATALQSAPDPNLVSGSLIITETGFALLLQDKPRNKWFQVIDESGTVVPESSSLVGSVRQEVQALRQLRYADKEIRGMSIPNASRKQPFDRHEYLRKCNAHFDNVKYAPLSALGFRFRRTSLSGIYVEASADVGDTSKKTQLTRALSEFVESLDLPKTQQQQLESQLRSQYGLSRTAEVGAARKVYQRYNSVVVLGDPGSGKTCFLKHEILGYCVPPSDQGSWYSYHLPIYVSLAEAARLLNENTSLLDVSAIVSSRRGIELPRSAIEDAISDGRAAFFFDGLDEVGYIDKRIALMSEIDALMRTSAPRGNRFVLASRPAAIQPVDIPEAFTFLHLKGLTEPEIRTLAARVLTARLGLGEDGSLSTEESELVDRLVADTRNKPGIERIATNPLLLTLLVLIYANTGALSARRHLIYTQAIKTLVSVRGRETREQQISEADLRTRLGTLALAIFQKDIPEIPGRQEVVQLLAPMVPVREDRSATEVADGFIQEVAESTGLLAIHSKDEEESDTLITFMHYSFLEYYAAAGLLAQDYVDAVPTLSDNPRWRDVTTLLFGMLSEQGDITPLLEGLLSDVSPSEIISNHRTVLALDCANECDVPPEESQELLATVVHATISTGAGRYSPDLRRKIAQRLEPLLQGTSRSMERALARGLRSEDPISAAAFADLTALIGGGVTLPPPLIEAFEEYLNHDDPVARATAMHTIERRPELRTEKSMDILRKTLKGNLIEKHAALKVVAVIPFDESLRDRTKKLLDDPNSLIAAGAAQCLLIDTLRSPDSTPRSPLLEKVLLKLHQDSSENTGVALQSVTLDRKMIYDLISGDDPTESELAIRHITLMKDDPRFTYKVLMQRLRAAKLPAHKAACLDSLRESPRAINLITIADTDVICEQLQDVSRNIRIAAIKLMGEMPSDEQIVTALQDHLNRSGTRRSRERELAETAKALAKHVGRHSSIRLALLESVLERLPQRAQDGFGNKMHQQHTQVLLSICESIGDTSNDRAAWRLHKLALDYRTPLEIRQRAFRVFGRLVKPSSASMDAFIAMLEHNHGPLNDSHYAATASFISRCRRKVEYVRQVYAKLDELRDSLYKSWQREISLSPKSINPHKLNNIRDASMEVSSLMVSYEEFSDRAKVST